MVGMGGAGGVAIDVSGVVDELDNSGLISGGTGGAGGLGGH